MRLKKAAGRVQRWNCKKNIRFIEDLRTRVDHALRDMLGIGCKVRFLNADTLPRSEGKAVRVKDSRKLV